MKSELGDRHSQALSLHQLGRGAHEQGRWARAVDCYQQALDILSKVGDRKAQASTRHSLGMLAQARGQWQQAEGWYRQALELESGDPFSQSLTYHQLGSLAQKQWERTKSFYQKAYALKEALGERHSLAITCYQLGSAAYEQRQTARAAEYCLKALAIFVDFEDVDRQVVTLRSLALLRGEIGTLAASVASLLGMTTEEAEELLRAALGDRSSEPDSGA